MRSDIRLLYLIPWQTDFAVTLVMFTVSRGIAEDRKSLLELGVTGAILSLTLADGSMVCGRLADRLTSRVCKA